MSDLNFIFDYPEETFRFLSLYESPIPCDCTLKRIMQMRPENFLYGTCSHGGQGVNLRDPKLTGILAQKCRPRPETVMAANPTSRTAAVGGAVKPYTVEPQVQRREKQVSREEGSQKASSKKSRRKSSSSKRKGTNSAPSRLRSGSSCLVSVTVLLSALLIATL